MSSIRFFCVAANRSFKHTGSERSKLGRRPGGPTLLFFGGVVCKFLVASLVPTKNVSVVSIRCAEKNMSTIGIREHLV